MAAAFKPPANILYILYVCLARSCFCTSTSHSYNAHQAPNRRKLASHDLSTNYLQCIHSLVYKIQRKTSIRSLQHIKTPTEIYKTWDDLLVLACKSFCFGSVYTCRRRKKPWPNQRNCEIMPTNYFLFNYTVDRPQF